ncbi:hypothetical protein Deipe_1714 [Deinococcus peraridilitoris DSM 19664]|uniref:Uncharacterized protein n=1 Tax=Deinococcus peraridilitoris (strain DSM 19664 / LMG 22246 / CIP 109416 / KR-200) TaxID=937777 RepID=L0A073_DEIPD|nr:hypothetical protein Deipe_1714 [Deinococcus peraridilitoris DSM 19664]
MSRARCVVSTSMTPGSQHPDLSVTQFQVKPDVTLERYVMAHCLGCGNEWSLRGLTSIRV